MKLVQRLREGYRAVYHQPESEVLLDEGLDESDEHSERRRYFDAVNHD